VLHSRATAEEEGLLFVFNPFQGEQSMRLVFKVFLVCFIVGILSTVVVAEDNLYWTGGGTSVSDVNNWIDDSLNPPTDLTLDHRCWVNMDSGNTPIITAADPYPGIFWDLNIGQSGAGGAGTVLQTGGATNIKWNLNIGGGTIADNPVSSLAMTGGTLYAGNEIYVGQSGGYGSLSIDNATVTNGGYDSGTDSYYGWTQIGREGGNGTLTMTGASTLFAGDQFRAGWIGGTGTVNLSGTSQIIARGFQNMGRNDYGWTGSTLYLNITGSAKMISTWNETSLGSNGGSAYVTINGSDESNYAEIGNNVDDYWVSFGRDDGSYCSLDMDGYSKVRSGWGGSVDIGVYGATADATMDGHATILPSGDFNVGCFGSATATLSMTGNSFVQANFMRFAEEGGSTATVTLNGSAQLYSPGEIRLGAGGTLVATLSGSSQINADGNLHIGLWGGSANVTMNPGTSMHAGGEFHINSFGTGTSTVTMDGASLEVNGEMLVAWDDNATGTLSMNNSTVTDHSSAQVGRKGNGTLIMTGNSLFHGDQDFRLGICGGTGTLNMSGTSVLEANNLNLIGANPGWDERGAGTAHINITGSAKLKSNYDQISCGNSGGRAEVYINGNDPGINPADESTWAQITAPAGVGWWVSFGRDAGSSATLEMRGYSMVRSCIFLDIATYGASATVDLYDDARLYANSDWGGTDNLSIGCWDAASSAQVTMHNRSLMNATAGGINFGVGGINNTLDMYDTSALIARDKITIGAGGTVVTMHDSSTMTAPSVEVGGTLKGNGSITGNVVSLAGSSIEPGTSIGVLTITGDLDVAWTLEFEYNQADPNKIDLLLVSGDLDLTSGILDFAVEASGSALTDPAYIFATYGTLSGSLPFEQNIPEGYRVEYAYSGNNIALVQVPEPSTLLLLALGLLGFACIRRGRK
jgi:hypothetical protein